MARILRRGEDPPRLVRHGGAVWVWSLDLAPRIAHSHANVLKAARAALADGYLPEGAIRWDEYETDACRRRWPCCLMDARGLEAVFRHLHGVPGCRDILAVRDEYLALFREQGRVMGSLADAMIEGLGEALDRMNGTAPGHRANGASAGRPSEIVTADPPSWQINAAVEVLRRSSLPDAIRDPLVSWNWSRCRALQGHARSLDEVGRIYATTAPSSLGAQEIE